MNARPNIILVHGAWADGSCWSSVIERLQAGGYHVTAPQFPMTALADDVARLRQVLNLQDGPTIVAAHSYGGQIMTALGTDTPNVAGLVYIAAFGLDDGESLGARDGRPGLEIPAVLVSGCHPGPGHPGGRRAHVRQPHGRHHHRGPLQPRRHGFPPGRSGPADHGRGRNLCRDSGIDRVPASATPQQMPDGGTRVAYDTVASAIARYHDAVASEVAQRLDTEVLDLLRQATGVPASATL